MTGCHKILPRLIEQSDQYFIWGVLTGWTTKNHAAQIIVWFTNAWLLWAGSFSQTHKSQLVSYWIELVKSVLNTLIGSLNHSYDSLSDSTEPFLTLNESWNRTEKVLCVVHGLWICVMSYCL